jgi:Family of unknown function (DUF5683)
VNFKIIFILCIAFNCQFFIAQKTDALFSKSQNDSIKVNNAKNKTIYSAARKATILSASFPGLGQVHNKKYWKMPIIYAALGGLTYWGIHNQQQYKFYSNNLRAANDVDANTINTTLYNNDQLIAYKNLYRKRRDLSILLLLGVYALNIIDANVDAHLQTFDVSDNLSLNLNPYANFFNDKTLQTGLTLKFNFK